MGLGFDTPHKPPKYNMKDIYFGVDVSDVPDVWIYTHFAEKKERPITQPMDGRAIKMRSFWSNDSNASLYFFTKDKRYLFHCFSTNIGGGPVQFVRHLEGLSTDVAAKQYIRNEYDHWKRLGNKFEPVSKIFALAENRLPTEYQWKKAEWSDAYYKFWHIFKVPPYILSKFNVFPLEEYIITRSDGQKMTFRPELAFVFCRKDGSAFQFYIPGGTPKYITLQKEYYPGNDQIASEGTKKNIGIFSGYKDILAFAALEIPYCDMIAGQSESRIIDSETMSTMCYLYINIFTFGDNDRTGQEMNRTYERVWCTSPIWVGPDHDVAESTRYNDLQYMKESYLLKMQQAIERKHRIT